MAIFDEIIFNILSFLFDLIPPTRNKLLSEKRAMAVGLFYVDNFGANPDNIFVEGMGSSQPVSQCGDLPRQQLISCLQPDRRVQVIFSDAR